MMRVFVAYNSDRVSLEVHESDTVGEIREKVRDLFNIGPDGSSILTLRFYGGELKTTWLISDLGLVPGCSLK